MNEVTANSAAAAASGSLLSTLIMMILMIVWTVGFVGMIVSGIKMARNNGDEEKIARTRKRFFVYLALFLVPAVLSVAFVVIARIALR